jgi:predicted nucleotidyltransferase
MPIYEPLFEALNEEGVRYVAVGGVAVVLHGHMRMTADVDLVIDLEPEEARKAIRALGAAGLTPKVPVDPEDFADPDVRREWVEEKGMMVFTMQDPVDPRRTVDLFVESPMDFEGLWERARVVELSGTPIRIVSIDDLIEMKRSAGRPQDMLDVEALEELKRRGSDA